MDDVKIVRISLSLVDKWRIWWRTVSLLLSAYLFSGLLPRTSHQGRFHKATWRTLHQVCLCTQSSDRISSSFAPSNTSTHLLPMPRAHHKHPVFQAITPQGSSTTLMLFQALWGLSAKCMQSQSCFAEQGRCTCCILHEGFCQLQKVGSLKPLPFIAEISGR